MSTDDGGNTWQMDVFNDFPSVSKLNDICFNNSGQGYVTGYGGLLLKTQLGVGISESGQYPELLIFPNPVEKCVSIRSSTNIENIKLFNEVGELLLENSSIMGKETMLDLSGFKCGIYFVKIDNSVQKIIKL